MEGISLTVPEEKGRFREDKTSEKRSYSAWRLSSLRRGLFRRT